jgi:hypothetical protein
MLAARSVFCSAKLTPCGRNKSGRSTRRGTSLHTKLATFQIVNLSTHKTKTLPPPGLRLAAAGRGPAARFSKCCLGALVLEVLGARHGAPLPTASALAGCGHQHTARRGAEQPPRLSCARRDGPSFAGILSGGTRCRRRNGGGCGTTVPGAGLRAAAGTVQR